MSEYSHCSICGGSFIGLGNVCPGCEDAISREPLEIRPIELKTRSNSADEADRSHANQETIAYIITEARGVFDELRKHVWRISLTDSKRRTSANEKQARKRRRYAARLARWWEEKRLASSRLQIVTGWATRRRCARRWRKQTRC